jgi:hypothetical protein
MGCAIGLGIALSLAASSAPGSTPAGATQARPRSVEVPASTVLAQVGGVVRLLEGGSGENPRRRRSGQGSTQPGSILVNPLTVPSHGPSSSDHGEGDHHHGGGTIIPIPIPIPTRPPYRPGPYYPPYYPSPGYIPGPSTTIIPSNTLPPAAEQPVAPEANVVTVQPVKNDFLKDLGFRPITVKELAAFKGQITQKNQELADQLKDVFKNNPAAIQAIGGLLASADAGKIDAAAIQQFVSQFGAGLDLAQQLKATSLLKQLVFNNIALGVLLNVNVNLLNINITNINLVNVNMNVMAGVWIGYWGFPWWPWDYPVWLGPGVWWGPCAYCPYPYYNPNLCGADALGLPYAIAAPVPDYAGQIVTSGILLQNGGGVAVNYTLDGQQFTMQPDYRQTIARRRLVIAFDRGGSFGRARYGIDEGWYKFTATDRGWELYKQTAKVKLDNSGNPFSFNYVLDNQRQDLPPQYQQDLTGKYPLGLSFDNGRGEVKQKTLEKGTFKIALSGDGGLDLFRPDDVTLPAPVAEMAKQFEQETPNIFAKPETIPSLFGKTASTTAPPPSSPPPPPGTPPPPPAPGVPSLFGNETG